MRVVKHKVTLKRDVIVMEADRTLCSLECPGMMVVDFGFDRGFCCGFFKKPRVNDWLEKEGEKPNYKVYRNEVCRRFDPEEEADG